jgi:hypothetical protein
LESYVLGNVKKFLSSVGLRRLKILAKY